MVDPGNNGKLAMTPQEGLQIQSMVFDVASNAHKAVYFGLLQAVGKFMAENPGVKPRDINIEVNTGFKLSRKSMIQTLNPPPPGDMRRLE